MDNASFERLKAQDWDNLSARLQRYAQGRVQRLGWATGSGKDPNLPKGMSSGDLACEAIARVFEGKRSWDPGKESDLFRFLCNVVDSLVYHLVHSEEHGERKKPADGALLLAEPGPDGRASQEDGLLELALEALDDDPALLKVFELCYDGMVKPADIACSMGLQVDQVYRLKEKMKRRLAGLRAVLKEGEPV